MAHSTSALAFFLVLVLFSLVRIEARESKFFAKAVVVHADTTTENVKHHVEPPSPSPSPSHSPAPAPVEAEINRGFGLYGRDDSFFENKIPTEAFDEKFGKDEFDNNGLPSNYNERSYVTASHGDNEEKFGKEEFSNNGLPSNYNERSYVTEPQGDNKEKFGNEEFNNNGLPSNYNERSYVTVPQGYKEEKFGNEEFNNNGLPSNYNEHSYVTVPQNTDLYDTKFTPLSNFENEFENNEEKLTPEEEKLFDENRNFNENSFVNSNRPQKFSETTRFAEKDNYFDDNKPQGLSDTRTLENGKYHYALGVPGRPRKHNNERYYDNNGEPKTKYEFDTMEEFERQEGYSQIPGEYINP